MSANLLRIFLSILFACSHTIQATSSNPLDKAAPPSPSKLIANSLSTITPPTLSNHDERDGVIDKSNFIDFAEPYLKDIDQLVTISQNMLESIETTRAKLESEEATTLRLFHIRFPVKSPLYPSLTGLDEEFLDCLNIPVSHTRNLSEYIFELASQGRHDSDTTEYNRLTSSLIFRSKLPESVKQGIKKFVKIYPELTKTKSKEQIANIIQQLTNINERNKIYLLRLNDILYHIPSHSKTHNDCAMDRYVTYTTIINRFFIHLDKLKLERKLGPFVLEIDNMTVALQERADFIGRMFHNIRVLKTDARLIWSINNHPNKTEILSAWAEFEFKLIRDLDNLVHFYRRNFLSFVFISGLNMKDLARIIADITGLEYGHQPSDSLFMMDSPECLSRLLDYDESNGSHYTFNLFSNIEAIQIQIGNLLRSYPKGDIQSLVKAYNSNDYRKARNIIMQSFSLTQQKHEELLGRLYEYSKFQNNDVYDKATGLVDRTVIMLRLSKLLMRSYPQEGSKCFLPQLFRTMACVNFLGLEIDSLLKKNPIKSSPLPKKKLKTGVNPYERYLIDGGRPLDDEDDDN